MEPTHKSQESYVMNASDGAEMARLIIAARGIGDDLAERSLSHGSRSGSNTLSLFFAPFCRAKKAT